MTFSLGETAVVKNIKGRDNEIYFNSPIAGELKLKENATFDVSEATVTWGTSGLQLDAGYGKYVVIPSYTYSSDPAYIWDNIYASARNQKFNRYRLVFTDDGTATVNHTTPLVLKIGLSESTPLSEQEVMTTMVNVSSNASKICVDKVEYDSGVIKLSILSLTGGATPAIFDLTIDFPFSAELMT